MIDATELVKELQGMRDAGFLSDALLRRAVRRLSESDDRFDWVGVYLLSDEEKELWLHNYIGSPTEHSKIAVGTGVCGTAVAEKANQRVDDVDEVDDYLACSPDARSELVVLIRAGDRIFGEIDIDSEQDEAFTEEDEAGIQAVSDKLAEQIMAERR